MLLASVREFRAGVQLYVPRDGGLVGTCPGRRKGDGNLNCSEFLIGRPGTWSGSHQESYRQPIYSLLLIYIMLQASVRLVALEVCRGRQRKWLCRVLWGIISSWQALHPRSWRHQSPQASLLIKQTWCRYSCGNTAFVQCIHTSVFWGGRGLVRASVSF